MKITEEYEVLYEGLRENMLGRLQTEIHQKTRKRAEQIFGDFVDDLYTQSPPRLKLLVKGNPVLAKNLINIAEQIIEICQEELT